MNISRREFWRKAVLAGVAVPWGARAAGAEAESWDLVAVRGGGRGEMLEAALELFGGWPGVLRGARKILVKPNIGWDAPPERGANTHPELVGAIVRGCLAAGATDVAVADHTCDPWRGCYETSGIAAAVRAAGGRMAPGNDGAMYVARECPGAEVLKSCRVHRLYVDSDFVINVPVLKHHGGARMTCGIKNLMGMVLDRRFYHSADLQRCIAEFLAVRKPEFTIVDAWHPMVRNGPRGTSADDLQEMRVLLASRDVVACDAAAARLLGCDPAGIGHVRLAAEMGFGRADLERLRIARLHLG